ncbi:hypothetical protein [Persephonella sp.]
MSKKRLKLALASILVAEGFLLGQGVATGVSAQGVSFIDDVKPYLEFRPRYEFVNVDSSTNDDANALTVRTKVGVKIGSVLGIEGLKAQIEAIDVSALIDDYDPQKSGYEKVVDPTNTRITQAFISYTVGKTTFIAGRKYVIIDDHRFIGTVNWRQMPQSFGILAVADNTIPNLNILAAGIYERKGITDSLNMDWKFDKMPLVFDINYTVSPQLKVKGFAYLITDVHNTYGIKASGNIDLGVAKLSYLGEYAQQQDPYTTDNAPSKPKIDTDYYRIKVGASSGGFFGNVMYTYFGDKGSKQKGFSVPLATNHKWDGWSDVLLAGAAGGFDGGLKELCISAGYKNPALGKIMVAYLTFNSDKSIGGIGKSVGSEIDALYAKKLTKRLSFLAKAAFYNADNGYYTGGSLNGTKDVTKYWLMLDYQY